MKLFSVPNLITLGNLFCGCLAVVFAFEGNLVWSAYLVGIAAVLDFLDGFAARLLKQYSPIGKELDSLADMVTFGFVPGVVMFQLLHASLMAEGKVDFVFLHREYLPYVAFLIPLFSALRLAKFNVDTRQSDSFIGVPTPANAILICSFALILNAGIPVTAGLHQTPEFSSNLVDYLGMHGRTYLDLEPSAPAAPFTQTLLLNKWFLLGVTLIMSFLLVSEIPLFALKIKTFGWKGNEMRYSFLALCLALLLIFQYAGLPLAIVLYVLLSLVQNMRKKQN